jgi:hypothetical protein
MSHSSATRERRAIRVATGHPLRPTVAGATAIGTQGGFDANLTIISKSAGRAYHRMMKPRPSHRAWRTIAAVILAIGAVPMSAHVVIVEQVVAVTIERAADLQVHLRVPAAVTGDPTLPGLLTSGPPT